MSQNLYTVSKQWASRPDDERFLSLDELYQAVKARKLAARESALGLSEVSVVPSADGKSIVLTDGQTFEAPFTHWSFGQLASRAGVPAAYLRTIPPELAALNIQYAIEHKLGQQAGEAGEDPGAAKLLLGPQEGVPLVLRAATSPTYGRIWDAEVVEAVQRRLGPDWKVPSASYASADPKRATTLYASDRDVFLFLVNESNPVEVPGTNGVERLHRGVIVWNSETGSASFGLCTFLYRYVCDNRIVWGAESVQELRIRHSSGGPARFLQEAAPRLKGYLSASTQSTVQVIQRAMGKELGKDQAEVVSWLRGRGFAQATAKAGYEAAQKAGLNPRSLWGAVQGLTDTAHELAHTDARMERERDAGALLDLVSK